MILKHANWPGPIDLDRIWNHWAGSVAAAMNQLPVGGIKVLGGEGVESWLEPVLNHVGRTIDASSKSVLDLSGHTLADGEVMANLPDEATIVVLLHPEHPPQGFDLYSTIHRHSLVVKFNLWMAATPLDLPEPSSLPTGMWTTQSSS